MKRFFLILIFLTALSWGCGEKLTLEQMETTVFANTDAGYSMTLPKDWTKLPGDWQDTGFVSADPPLSCSVMTEIGGLDFYSSEGLAKEVVRSLGTKFKEISFQQGKVWTEGTDYRFLANGQTAEGKPLSFYVILLEPDTGIRYYLVFAAEPKDMTRLKGLFDQVAGSFKRTQSKEELYQTLHDRNADKLNQEKGPQEKGKN